MATAIAPEPVTVTGVQYTFDQNEIMEMKDQGNAQRLAEAIAEATGLRVMVNESGIPKRPMTARFSVLTSEGGVRHPSFTGVPIVVKRGGFVMTINPR